MKTKTIYDSEIIPYQEMIELAKEAAVKGFEPALAAEGQAISTVEVKGINFVVYVDRDAGIVRNFHPVSEGE